MWRKYMTWIKQLRLVCDQKYSEICEECEDRKKKGNPDFECPKKKIETGYYTKKAVTIHTISVRNFLYPATVISGTWIRTVYGQNMKKGLMTG